MDTKEAYGQCVGKYLELKEKLAAVTAELEEQTSAARAYDAELVQAQMLLEQVNAALDGDEPSDFSMSFPIVRKAYEQEKEQAMLLEGKGAAIRSLQGENKELKAENQRLRGLIKRALAAKEG